MDLIIFVEVMILSLGVRFSDVWRMRLAPVMVLLVVNAASALAFLRPTVLAGSRRESYEIYGVVVGLAIVGALILAFRRWPGESRRTLSRRETRWLDALMLATVGLAVFGGFVGIAQGNSLGLVAGDVFKLTLTPAVYYLVCLSNLQRRDLQVLLVAMGVILLLQQGREVIATWTILRSGLVSRLTPLLWMQNLAGAVAFGVCALRARSMGSRLLSLLAMGLFVGIAMGFGFRAYLAILALVFATPLVLVPRVAVRKYLPPLVLALVALVPTLLAGLALSPACRQMASTVIEATARRLDPGSGRPFEVGESNRERQVEVESVFSALIEHPSALLTGFGAGAVFKLPPSASVYALRRAAASNFHAHHIHNTFASYLYRYGLLGLVYIIMFTLIVALVVVHRFSRVVTIASWFPFLTLLAYLAGSPFFLLIPGDVIFAVCLGWLAVDIRLAHARSVERVGSSVLSRKCYEGAAPGAWPERRSLV